MNAFLTSSTAHPAESTAWRSVTGVVTIGHRAVLGVRRVCRVCFACWHLERCHAPTEQTEETQKQ